MVWLDRPGPCGRPLCLELEVGGREKESNFTWAESGEENFLSKEDW